MSEFRKCVALLFERLGMDRPAELYLDDVEALNRAAAEWHRSGARAPLHFELPDLLAGELVTGNLNHAERAGWCGNQAAKNFVAFCDERTGHRCTLLMLQIVLLLQQAAQAGRVNARGGTS